MLNSCMRRNSFERHIKTLFYICLMSVLPLLIGGLIYVSLRPSSLLMFAWFEYLGLDFIINLLHSFMLPYRTSIPDIIIFSLPNALWAFALTNLMIYIWRDHESSLIKFCFIASGAVLGIGFELLQLIAVIPGTYDKLDSITIILFTALSGMIQKARCLCLN